MSLSVIGDENLKKEKETIHELLRCSDKFESVVFNSGAGSGKTYALVECLKYIIECNRDTLKNHNQKVACITYTNVAADHIKKQIGASDVVEISTIHERIWEIIQEQKSVLLKLHIEKLNAEILNINNELSNNADYAKYGELDIQKQEEFLTLMQFNKREYNRAYNLNAAGFRAAMPVELKTQYSELIKSVGKFKALVDKLFRRKKYLDCLDKIESGDKDYRVVKYDAMYNRDRLDKMRISHDTLLEYGYQVVMRYRRMRQMIIDCYPYILIDEYQDTADIVVNIMNLVDHYGKEIGHNVFVAYFGDSVQSIYDTGVGKALSNIHDDLHSVFKTYNRRSYKEIIDVANRVRNDEIVQESIYSDCNGGSIRFYHGNENNVNEFIDIFSKKWGNSMENPLHCLFATNQMVAEYSGFLLLYEAIKSADVYRGVGYKQLNSEFLSNDVIRLGRSEALLYRLMKLYCEVHLNETPLRSFLQTEEYRNMSFCDLKIVMKLLKSVEGNSLDELLVDIFRKYDSSQNKIYQLIVERVFDIDGEASYDSVLKYLATSLYTSWDEELDVKTVISALLNVKLDALLSWYHYIHRDEKKDICYHTFHSTKGLEYENVVIILGKDFGIERGLFETYFADYGKNLEEALEKYEKGRNILYVAVTRAIKNLRILYIDNVDGIQDKVSTIFGEMYAFPKDIETES